MEGRSRRRFLQTFITPAKETARDIARSLNDVRSENQHGTPGLQFIDRITEHGAEAFVAVLATAAALDALTNKMYVMEVKPRERMGDDPKVKATTEKTLYEARAGLYDLARVLEQLAHEWRKGYLKTRTVRKTSTKDECDSNGKNCVKVEKVTYEDEEYWDEPHEFTSRGINNDSIGHMLDYVRGLDDKFVHALKYFASVPTFKYKDESYDYDAKPLDAKSQTLGRAVGFGLSAFGFAFYEEIIAKIAQRSSSLPEALVHLSETKIKRRSVFKLGGGALVVAQTGGLQAAIALENTTFDNEVRKKSRELIEYGVGMSPDVTFQAYFDQSVDQQIKSLSDWTELASKGVSASTTWTENRQRIEPLLRDVHTRLMAVTANIKKSYNYADRLEYTLPPELVAVAKSMKIHEWVQGYVGHRNFETSASWLAEVGRFALALLAVGVTAEVIAEATDRAINKALYQQIS